MTYLVVLAFVAILGSLAAALLFMLKRPSSSATADDSSPRGRHMARALAFRVGFSIVLFVVILVSYWMGWIQPTGIPPGR